MSETPSSSDLLKGISWATLAHVGSQILWFGSLLIIAGLVTPAEYGTVALALTVVLTASVVLEAGGSGALIASRRVTAGGFWRTVAITTGLALVLTLLMAALARPLVDAFAPEGDVDPVRVVALAFVMTGAGIGPIALLTKQLLFKRLALLRVAATASGAVVGVVAAIAGAGVWALVARQLVYQGLQSILAWLNARRVIPKRSVDDATAERPKGARWFALLSAANLLAMSVDNLIVGSRTSASELGLYTLAFALGFAPLTQVSWVVGGVLFPAAAASERDAVIRRTLLAARMTGLLLLPLVPPAVVLAPELLPAALGDEWKPSVPVFQLLLVSGVAHAVVNVVGESLGGIGEIRWRSLVTIAWAFSTAVAVFVLTGTDGIRGAAWAHVLLILPYVLVMATTGVRRLGGGTGDFWRAIRPVLAAVAVQAAVVFGLNELLPGDDVLVACVAAAAGLAVVAAAVLRDDGPLSVRAVLRARHA